MSNITKLATTSLVHVWPVVDLASAGSHGALLLDVGFSVQFWSRCFSSPERFEAVVFRHSPTLPTLIAFYSPFHWPNQCWRVPGMGAHGWVAGICQRWGLYSIWGLARHSGSPWIPQAPTFHLSETAVNICWLSSLRLGSPPIIVVLKSSLFLGPSSWASCGCACW